MQWTLMEPSYLSISLTYWMSADHSLPWCNEIMHYPGSLSGRCEQSTKVTNTELDAVSSTEKIKHKPALDNYVLTKDG